MWSEFQGSPGKSQKEGREDQGTLKHLGGGLLALLPFPVSAGLKVSKRKGKGKSESRARLG